MHAHLAVVLGLTKSTLLNLIDLHFCYSNKSIYFMSDRLKTGRKFLNLSNLNDGKQSSL